MLRTVSARYSAGGVAVGHERIAQRLGALLRAPDLREGEEEALIAGEAVC